MATGTQGEDAGVGIFAADKYHQSDEDATKNAKDDITRQGMEIAQTDKPLTEEARNPHAITGVKPHPSTATNVNPAISKTLDEISRPAATDADFLAWVEKNQGPPEQVDYITEHCRRDSIETVEAMRVRGGSFSSAGLPRSRKGSSGSAAGYEHDHGHHHRGPVKTVLHALHLDMKDRKKEKAAHKEATAIAMEQEDMDKWANKLKERHERKLKKYPPKGRREDLKFTKVQVKVCSAQESHPFHNTSLPPFTKYLCNFAQNSFQSTAFRTEQQRTETLVYRQSIYGTPKRSMAFPPNSFYIRPLVSRRPNFIMVSIHRS